ncbi:MAG TPA: hypothetical protein VFP42_11620 [Acidimicrobiia bacterium]|nr:hypothetical protein [Acidimicrobiia bacterium]
MEAKPSDRSHIPSGMWFTGNFPTLDRHFQSSVPGLFFVGSASAAAFGPLMRFVLGARFTARVLERRLA